MKALKVLVKLWFPEAGDNSYNVKKQNQNQTNVTSFISTQKKSSQQKLHKKSQKKQTSQQFNQVVIIMGAHIEYMKLITRRC